MRFSIVALLGLAAIAYAQDVEADVATPGGEVTADNTVEGEVEVDTNELYKGPFGFPPGISPPKKPFMPKLGPPKGVSKEKKGLPMWHPPHKGVFIDDCDDDKDEKWHWAKKTKKHPKPMIPHHKWTTSTVTATKTKTVIDCPDHIPDCPGKPKTKYTTTTVEVTTTICPIPITDMPHPPKPTWPAKPTGEPMPPPPKPTEEPMPYPPKPTKEIPPMIPTKGPEGPPAPEVSKPPAMVTAGAAQNAVGALAAVAAVAAALI